MEDLISGTYKKMFVVERPQQFYNSTQNILRLYHLHNSAYITGCVLFIFILLVLFVLMFGILYVCLYCIFVCFFICYTTLHSETDGKEDVHGCLSQPAECRCRCTGQGSGFSFHLKIRRFLLPSAR